ncbi:MAG: hypothetical protein LBH97_03450 [Treponema sp.]|jgi:hypothetical protein|nr:hypothetical protein [Treponema sp.]
MALQPIDLQTLFSQLDKVAKTQTAQREGLATQQAMQGIHLQKKTEENIQSVNESQDMGEGVEKVNDRKEQGEGRGDGRKREAASEDGQPEEQQPSVISDPSLGNNIDISF